MKAELIKKWKSISDSEKQILGRPNFACGQITRKMREKGFNCESSSEDEQAMVIFTMLEFYKKHGEEWAKEMNEWLKSE